MAQTLLQCNCCGLADDFAHLAVCPVCRYPLLPADEVAFLERSLSDLRRVIYYNGTTLTVANLANRYEGRLQSLRAQGQELAKARSLLSHCP